VKNFLFGINHPAHRPAALATDQGTLAFFKARLPDSDIAESLLMLKTRKPEFIAFGKRILCHKADDMNPEFLNAYFRIPEEPVMIPQEFVIVTAFNPDGVVQEEVMNQSLDSDLAACLHRHALSHWRVIGGSHDLAHSEPGYGIETSLANGIEIGLQFRQVAVFWVQRGDIYVVDCSTRQQMSVGKWQSRILR
jgi:hypothetical protein